MKNMARRFARLNEGKTGAAGENVEVPFAERRYGLNHLCYQGTQVTITNPTSATKKEEYVPAQGHLADCEFPRLVGARVERAHCVPRQRYYHRV